MLFPCVLITEANIKSLWGVSNAGLLDAVSLGLVTEIISDSDSESDSRIKVLIASSLIEYI
jgi:hypothetical protein